MKWQEKANTKDRPVKGGDESRPERFKGAKIITPPPRKRGISREADEDEDRGDEPSPLPASQRTVPPTPSRPVRRVVRRAPRMSPVIPAAFYAGPQPKRAPTPARREILRRVYTADILNRPIRGLKTPKELQRQWPVKPILSWVAGLQPNAAAALADKVGGEVELKRQLKIRNELLIWHLVEQGELQKQIAKMVEASHLLQHPAVKKVDSKTIASSSGASRKALPRRAKEQKYTKVILEF